MTTRRTRSRKEPSVIAVAIKSEWWVSAFLSAGIFALNFVIIPAIGFQNLFFRTFTVGLKPMMTVLGITFAVIALFNYFRQSKVAKPSHEKSYAYAFPSPPSSATSEHQIIHKVAKDNTQVGYSNVQPPHVPAEVKRHTSWSIDLLQKIEWKLFEDLSAAYYQEKGIRSELTKLGADGGIDIKLFQDDSKKPTSIVQCKAWNSLVGVKPIREFLGVMTHEKIPKGFYMTPSSYTEEARKIGIANRITLIDGNMFLMMIQRLPADAQQRLLDLVIKDDYTTPTCSQCGIKMVRRPSRRGEFWGCKNYPRCHQKLNIRSGYQNQ